MAEAWRGEESGDELLGSSPLSPPPTTESISPSQGGGALYKKTERRGPFGVSQSLAELGLGHRGTAALIEARLATAVHPNPAPGVIRGRRGGGEENRRKRKEGKYERRRETAMGRRRRLGCKNVGMNECVIVTCNGQGMSVRANNRVHMRRVVDKIVRERWEVVCQTEIKAESDGVVWLREEECRVV